MPGELSENRCRGQVMPIHDWTRVDAGIFHDFHHAWIEEIKRSLNRGVLPPDYYALAEQFAGGFGPDVLTLPGAAENGGGEEDDDGPASPPSSSAAAGGGAAVLAAAAPAPALVPTDETDMAFYRRKQNAIVVRHVTGDRVVAMVEVVSPGNKA